ncbi:MAG: response regulator [Thermodesulfobacteriota bacterium]
MKTRKDSILIVDDDPEQVWSLGRYFTRAGYSVTTCGDGEEAISVLESRHFEAVITDIKMPRLNGLALVDWLRENRPCTRVVVMTAFGGPSIRHLSITKGAILYLEKPVDPDLLADALSASKDDTAFSGAIDKIDILDYLQLIMLTGRRVVVEVSSKDGGQGLIYIEKGEVRHAKCGLLEGEEALFKCLAFEGGNFVNLPWTEPEKITIAKPGDFLLMEAARKRDEARAMVRHHDDDGRTSSSPADEDPSI